MIPKAMDSLDLVEAVMLIEEILGTEIPDSDVEASAAHGRWWTGLTVTCQTNDPPKRPLRYLEGWPNLTTTLNWPRAWKAHGDENRLRPSCAKSFGSRVLSVIAGFVNHPDRLSQPSLPRNGITSC